MNKRRLGIALPVFVLYIALMCVFSPNRSVFIGFAFSALIHEGAHILALKRAGIQAAFIGPVGCGLCLVTQTKKLSGKTGVKVYSYGIAANLLFALIIYLIRFFLIPAIPSELIFVNLLHAAVNLIPAYPSDGSRILYCALLPSLGAFKATKAVCVLSRGIGAVFFLSGAYIFLFVSDNFLLMLWGSFIFFSVQRELEAAAAEHLKAQGKKARAA